MKGERASQSLLFGVAQYPTMCKRGHGRKKIGKAPLDVVVSLAPESINSLPARVMLLHCCSILASTQLLMH
jgi:hypothetical protein